jgi:predicted aspartyl protease
MRILIAILITLASLMLSSSLTLPGEVSPLNNNELRGLRPEADMLIIPLKNAGRIYMIEAIIDNQEGNLIFDTGASDLVLNGTYFRKYLKQGTYDPGGITGSAGTAERISTSNMIVSGLRYTNVTALLSNLSHIENRYGVKILGLFGFSLLKDFEVVIDIHRNELRIYRIDSRGDRTSASDKLFQGNHSQKIEESQNIVFLLGTIGGKTLKFCLDTGAETNAIDFSCPEKVLQSISVMSSAKLSGAGTLKSEVLVGKMNELNLGTYSLRNMTTIITRLDALESAYGQMMDGVLGYDFLTRGQVCINFRKMQLDMKILNEEQK